MAAAACESRVIDVECLIRDYSPELGLSAFLSEHVRVTPPAQISPGHAAIEVSDPGSLSLRSTQWKGHEYYKQPGKCHNRDRCDACQGIGNILCCDQCPASFHLRCFDPPISGEDLDSEWTCRECTVRINGLSMPEMKFVTQFEEFSRSCGVDSDDCFTEGSEFLSPASRKRTRQTRSSSPSAASPEKKRLKSSYETPIAVIRSSIEKLISFTCSRNPREFSLPATYSLSEPLPGTSWSSGGAKFSAANTSAQNQTAATAATAQPAPQQEQAPGRSTKPLVTVDTDGLVPTPVLLCYRCGRSCSAAPLIACDFCPAAFHLECVDPPLTCAPQGRWMCMLHPHMADRTRLRHKLWTTRVAYHAIMDRPVNVTRARREFLQRVRRAWPPWTGRLSSQPGAVSGWESEECEEIPAAVKEMYDHPVTMEKAFFIHGDDHEENNLRSSKLASDWTDSEESALLTLKKSLMVAYESALRRHNEVLENSLSEGNSLVAELRRPETDDCRLKVGVIANNEPEEKPEIAGAENTTFLTNTPDGGDISMKQVPTLKSICQKITAMNDGVKSEPLDDVNNPEAIKSPNAEIKQPEDDIATDEADAMETHATRDILRENPSMISAPESNRTGQTKHTDILPISRMDPSRALRDPRFPSRHQPAKDPVAALVCPYFPSHVIEMTSSTLHVGTRDDVSLDLSVFTRCPNLSTSHAVIFQDKIGGGGFELQNYSEFGTTVDGVFYGLDSSLALDDQPADHSLTSQIRSFNSRPVGSRDQHMTHHVINSTGLNNSVESQLPDVRRQCSCEGRKRRVGWEGSAPLKHASVVYFGCLPFVFSVFCDD